MKHIILSAKMRYLHDVEYHDLAPCRHLFSHTTHRTGNHVTFSSLTHLSKEEGVLILHTNYQIFVNVC